jgi:hypothetical protein
VALSDFTDACHYMSISVPPSTALFIVSSLLLSPSIFRCSSGPLNNRTAAPVETSAPAYMEMASISLPELTISTFTKGLETYAHILAKAQDYAREKGIDVNTFVFARLIEDQLPFSFQVQNATKAVQLNLGRLSGEEPLLFENNEQTFEDLQRRITKTLDVVRLFDVAKADGRDEAVLDLYVSHHNSAFILFDHSCSFLQP